MRTLQNGSFHFIHELFHVRRPHAGIAILANRFQIRQDSLTPTRLGDDVTAMERELGDVRNAAA
jgi:hypothetical protein